jgi:uncharacterized protein (DUF1778 family)
MAKPASNGQRNTVRVTASVPDHIRARIEEAAAWKGVSVAAFVAEAAASLAEQVIERERSIQLSREDVDLIASLLENPPSPNAALLKAAELHKRLIGG